MSKSAAKHKIEDLEREIRSEKDSVKSTLQSIQELLPTDTLIGVLSGTLRGKESDIADFIATTVRRNPTAASVTAIGLVWLLYSGVSSQSGKGSNSLDLPEDLEERLTAARELLAEKTGKAQSRAGKLGANLYDGTEELSVSARKRAKELIDRSVRAEKQIKETVKSAEANVQDFYSEHPVATGIIAGVTGAAIVGLLARKSD